VLHLLAFRKVLQFFGSVCGKLRGKIKQENLSSSVLGVAVFVASSTRNSPGFWRSYENQ